MRESRRVSIIAAAIGGVRILAYAIALSVGFSVKAFAETAPPASQSISSTAQSGWTVVRPGESAEIPAVVSSPALNTDAAPGTTWLSDDSSGALKPRAPGSYTFFYRFTAKAGTSVTAIPAMDLHSAGCITSVALNGATVPLTAEENCPPGPAGERTLNLADAFPNAALQDANTLTFTVFNRYQGDDGGTLALAVGPIPPPPPPVAQVTAAPQPVRRPEPRVAQDPPRSRAVRSTHIAYPVHVAATYGKASSRVRHRITSPATLHVPRALLFCTNESGDSCQDIVTFHGGVGRMKTLGNSSSVTVDVFVDRLTHQNIAMHAVTPDGRRLSYHGVYSDGIADGVVDVSSRNQPASHAHWWAIPAYDYGKLDHVPGAFYACFGDKCDKDPQQANRDFYVLKGREGTGVLPNKNGDTSIGSVYVISSTAKYILLRWTREDSGETIIFGGVITARGDLRGGAVDFLADTDCHSDSLIGTIPSAVEQSRISAAIPNTIARIESRRAGGALMQMFVGALVGGGSGDTSSEADQENREREGNDAIYRQQQQADEDASRAEENARLDAESQAESDYEQQRNDAWAAESQSQ